MSDRYEDGPHTTEYRMWSQLDGTITEDASAAEADGVRVPEPDRRISSGESEPQREQLAELARRHLGPHAAEEWLGLLRTGLRLAHAGPGDPVIAQLGGLPTLPINSWPMWEGHGPLSHVLSIDCAPVTQALPKLGLPDSGRLAFFYFDGHYDDLESYVGPDDTDSQTGGVRVLLLHPERSTRADPTDVPTPAPPGLTPFPAVGLTAIPTLYWPWRDHPEVRPIWERHGLPPDHGVGTPGPIQDLYQALWDRWHIHPLHMLGGHADPEQDAVEYELAYGSLRAAGEHVDYGSPAVTALASQWRLLLQVDSDDDADMMWGDVGKIYFMIKPADLEARRFGEIRLSLQSV